MDEARETLTAQEWELFEAFTCQIEASMIEAGGLELLPGEPGYIEFVDRLSLQLPFRKQFMAYPMLFKLGQVAVLCFIGFLFLYLRMGRYTKANPTRVLKR